MDPDWLIHLGDAPNRIGIRTRLLGYPKFATLWKNRVVAQFGNVPANFLGLDDLIAAKGASEQTKDWADRHELNLVKKRTRRTPGQEPT